MRKLLISGACASMGAALSFAPLHAMNVGEQSSSQSAGIQLIRDGGGSGGRGGDGGASRGGERGSSGVSTGESGSSGRSSSFDGGRRGGDGGARGERSRGDRGDRGDRHGGRHAHRGHRHRHGGVGIYIGDGYYDRGYSYGDCGWLRRKAIRTGSGYWWRRYEDCID